MRLDKYLKISRLIKRRTVANEACDAGKILVNGKSICGSQGRRCDRDPVWNKSRKSRSPGCAGDSQKGQCGRTL